MESPRETRARMSEEIDVILNSVSGVIVICVILLLLLYLYMKSCICCTIRAYTPEHHTESHHQSRHTMRVTCSDEPVLTRISVDAINQAAVGPQPNDYHLEDLPSYETVCRKDKQRHIYSMIAQRFSLIGSNYQPPPTYEETFPQSL